jgi:hypothetical protein
VRLSSVHLLGMHLANRHRGLFYHVPARSFITRSCVRASVLVIQSFLDLLLLA